MASLHISLEEPDQALEFLKKSVDLWYRADLEEEPDESDDEDDETDTGMTGTASATPAKSEMDTSMDASTKVRNDFDAACRLLVVPVVVLVDVLTSRTLEIRLHYSA